MTEQMSHYTVRALDIADKARRNSKRVLCPCLSFRIFGVSLGVGVHYDACVSKRIGVLYRPNPVLEIEGNPNQRNNRNQACGRAFALGVAEAPQDPNVMMGTFSVGNKKSVGHFQVVIVLARS
ncbi:hypothetical protein Tco_1478059 [Tanacetum coccineum]